MELYRLIYVSYATMGVKWEDLKDILAKSEQNNAELDITGLLVVSGNTFLQVLEGPQRALNVLYSKILVDPRHENPVLLGYTPIHDRHFSEWAMKGVNVALLQPELTSFLFRKYGGEADAVDVPYDHFKAYSLLYDMYHLSKG
jgi:hypothetical protein